MRAALVEARKALASNEVPIGAVVEIGGQIVAAAFNQPISGVDPTAHAEIGALRAAAQKVGNYRLTGATLCVTVEPCAMCVGALRQARVARIVFGCCEPKGGALGSVCDLRWDGAGGRPLDVRGGVCAEEASALLQDFFRVRRGA